MSTHLDDAFGAALKQAEASLKQWAEADARLRIQHQEEMVRELEVLDRRISGLIRQREERILRRLGR